MFSLVNFTLQMSSPRYEGGVLSPLKDKTKIAFINTRASLPSLASFESGVRPTILRLIIIY